MSDTLQESIQAIEDLKPYWSPSNESLQESTRLRFWKCRNGRLPEAISILTQLQELHAYKLELTLIPKALSGLIALTHLQLHGNLLDQLHAPIFNLTNLRELHLQNNMLSRLEPLMARFKQLTYLDISNNNMTEVPPIISSLQQLNVLSCCGLQLPFFPSCVTSLVHLTELRLLQNPISTLPEVITSMRNLKKLDLDYSAITYPPPFITKHGLDFIQGFLSEPVSHSQWTAYAGNVVYLGASSADKSSIIQRIQTNRPSVIGNEIQSESESRICRGDFQLSGSDYRNLVLTGWEFQNINSFQATMAFFQESHTLFVLFIKANDQADEEQAKVWISILSFYQPTASLLIVWILEGKSSADATRPLPPKLQMHIQQQAPCIEIIGSSCIAVKTDQKITSLVNCIKPFFDKTQKVEYEITARYTRMLDILLQKAQNSPSYFVPVQEVIRICLVEANMKPEQTNFGLRCLRHIGLVYWNPLGDYFGELICIKPRLLIHTTVEMFLPQMEGDRDSFIPEDMTMETLIDTLRREKEYANDGSRPPFMDDLLENLLKYTRSLHITCPILGLGEVLLFSRSSETKVPRKMEQRPLQSRLEPIKYEIEYNIIIPPLAIFSIVSFFQDYFVGSSVRDDGVKNFISFEEIHMELSYNLSRSQFSVGNDIKLDYVYSGPFSTSPQDTTRIELWLSTQNPSFNIVFLCAEIGNIVTRKLGTISPPIGYGFICPHCEMKTYHSPGSLLHSLSTKESRVVTCTQNHTMLTQSKSKHEKKKKTLIEYANWVSKRQIMKDPMSKTRIAKLYVRLPRTRNTHWLDDFRFNAFGSVAKEAAYNGITLIFVDPRWTVVGFEEETKQDVQRAFLPKTSDYFVYIVDESELSSMELPIKVELRDQLVHSFPWIYNYPKLTFDELLIRAACFDQDSFVSRAFFFLPNATGPEKVARGNNICDYIMSTFNFYKYEKLEDLLKTIPSVLLEAINADLSPIPRHMLSLEEMQEHHIQRHAQFFFGAGAVVETIKLKIRASRSYQQHKPILVYGSPGCGKTSLLSHLRQTIAHGSDGRGIVASHFVLPADNRSTTATSMFHRILHHIKAGLLKFGYFDSQSIDMITPNQGLSHLALILGQRFSANIFYLIIDRVDRIEELGMNLMQSTQALPRQLPPNVHIIFTGLEPSDDFESVKIQDLMPDEAADMTRVFLKSHAREMPVEIVDKIIGSSVAKSPALLRLVLLDIVAYPFGHTLMDRIKEMSEMTSETLPRVEREMHRKLKEPGALQTTSVESRMMDALINLTHLYWSSLSKSVTVTAGVMGLCRHGITWDDLEKYVNILCQDSVSRKMWSLYMAFLLNYHTYVRLGRIHLLDPYKSYVESILDRFPEDFRETLEAASLFFKEQYFKLYQQGTICIHYFFEIAYIAKNRLSKLRMEQKDQKSRAIIIETFKSFASDPRLLIPLAKYAPTMLDIMFHEIDPRVPYIEVVLFKAIEEDQNRHVLAAWAPYLVSIGHSQRILSLLENSSLLGSADSTMDIAGRLCDITAVIYRQLNDHESSSKYVEKAKQYYKYAHGALSMEAFTGQSVLLHDTPSEFQYERALLEDSTPKTEVVQQRNSTEKPLKNERKPRSGRRHVQELHNHDGGGSVAGSAPLAPEKTPHTTPRNIQKPLHLADPKELYEIVKDRIQTDFADVLLQKGYNGAAFCTLTKKDLSQPPFQLSRVKAELRFKEIQQVLEELDM